jgi:2-polyprenyl-3-methyl-5-hydroxy-6-metoxy-1,4-benzoquinol methylase
MNTIKTRDDDINVEEILLHIRENIKKRRESWAGKEATLIYEPLDVPVANVRQDDLQLSFNYINSNWDVHSEYSISSHRPLLGRILVWGRRLVHGEVRRYVDLIATKQSEFNAHVLRAFNGYIKSFDSKVNEAVAAVNKDIDTKVNVAVSAVNSDIDTKVNATVTSVNNDIDTKLNATVTSINNDIDTKLNATVTSVNNGIDTKLNATVTSVNNGIDTKVKAAVVAINNNIDTKLNDAMMAVNKDIDVKVNEVVATVNEDIGNKAWLANLLDKRIKRKITKQKPLEGKADNAMNYFVFEEKFRGSTEDIKQRQSIFLEYFKNCQNVLDIGCGRGEFLSILKENSIGAKGIDINEDMVLYCQKNGFDVQKAEGLSYLRSLENKSLDGVFSGQVVEHLQPEELVNLVKLCYDKMKYGTYFIAETINPLCLSVFAASFYMDLSHVKPIHPETIKFLLESMRFRDIQFKFFSPFPESTKLSTLKISDSMSSEEKARLEAMNQNIEKLNSLLYSYQDYAVIAKK